MPTKSRRPGALRGDGLGGGAVSGGRGGQAPTLTDAAIVAIFDYANTRDIETAQLAVDRASSERVKEFAATFARDQTQVRVQGRALAKKLGVTPVVRALKETLLPAIENPELKKFVETVVPAFEGHLHAAQDLKAQVVSY